MDIDELWKETDDGLRIFEYYYPDLKVGKHFKSRPTERTASAMVRLYQGKYYYKDFGSSEKAVNGIDYVMQEEGLEFIDALKFIQDVIVRKIIGSGNFVKPKYSPDYSSREILPDDNFSIRVTAYHDNLSQSQLRILGRYVTKELAKEYNYRSVKSYEVIGKKRDKVHIFSSTDDYPIFEIGYSYTNDNNVTHCFAKIYQPYAKEKKNRFMFIGTPPEEYIYGYDQLMKRETELEEEDVEEAVKSNSTAEKFYDIVRVSGPSDLLAMASLGYNCYYTTSETDKMTYAMFDKVNCLSRRNHYILFDIDTTGITSAVKFCIQYLDVRMIILPDYIRHKRDRRGGQCKDIKDFVENFGTNMEDTANRVNRIRYDAQPLRFWDRIDNKEGKITFSINFERMLKFLNYSGYYKLNSDEHKTGYAYAHLDGSRGVRIIDSSDDKLIKSEIKLYLRNFVIEGNYFTKSLDIRKDEKIKLLNIISKSTQISNDQIHLLPEKSFCFKNYSEEYETIIFNNTAIKITKDEIIKIKHSDLENYFIREMRIGKRVNICQLNNRTFNSNIESPVIIEATEKYKALLDRLDNAQNNNERIAINFEIAQLAEIEKYEMKIVKQFIFTEFLQDISRIYWQYPPNEMTAIQKKEEELTMINLLFNIGYLAAEKKYPEKAWFVLFQDALVTQVGKSSGRSGKSLICKFLTYFRPTYYVGAKNKKVFENDFLYDGFTKYHSIIEFDDLYEHADPNKFYDETTGKRSVNSKFLSPQILDYEDSGKTMVSFNHSWKDNSPSAIARIQPGIVSDYFHEKTPYNDYKSTWTPVMKYGRRLYDSFTQNEWDMCANLLAYCIQLTMRFDRIKPPVANVMKRELQLVMEKGLYKYEVSFEGLCDEYFTIEQNTLNRLILREDFNSSINNALPGRNEISSQSLKERLIAYCIYKEFEFNPISHCTGTEAELKTLAGLPETPKNLSKRRIIKKISDGLGGTMRETKEHFYISTEIRNDAMQLIHNEIHKYFEGTDIDIDNNLSDIVIEYNQYIALEGRMPLTSDEFLTAYNHNLTV